MFYKIQLICLFIFTLYGCSETSPVDLVEIQTGKEINSYQKNIKGIIANNCISCHSTVPTNGAPMSLNSLASLKEAIVNRGLINRINLDVSNNLAMPLGGPKLLESQINSIVKWQNEGFVD